MTGLTIDVIISFFTITILIIATAQSFYRFFQLTYRQFLYITLNWCGIALWLILTTVSSIIKYDMLIPGISAIDIEVGLFTNLPIISNILSTYTIDIVIFVTPISLSHMLGLLGLFCIFPTSIFLILLVDSINRTSVDPTKAGILGLIAATVIIAALQPGQGPQQIYAYTYFAQLLIQFLWTFLWIFYALKLYINSPENLQRFALILLVGTILACVIPAFNTITGLIPPGQGPNELSFAIGILLMTGTFIYQPGLLFILPYKISRLGVFNERGVPLFSHQWISSEDDPVSEMFFTEMKQGVSGILSESLKQGNISEIHFDKTILLIERYKNFSFVLLTVKTSRSLKNSLTTFSVKFVTKFEELLAKSVYIDPKDHETASTIVVECFPFLPT